MAISDQLTGSFAKVLNARTTASARFTVRTCHVVHLDWHRHLPIHVRAIHAAHKIEPIQKIENRCNATVSLTHHTPVSHALDTGLILSETAQNCSKETPKHDGSPTFRSFSKEQLRRSYSRSSTIGMNSLNRNSKGLAACSAVLLATMIVGDARTNVGFISVVLAFVVLSLGIFQRLKAVRGWFDGVSSSAISNVSSNPTLSRIRTSVNASSMRLLAMASKRATQFNNYERYHALTAKDAFLPDADTEKLSLSDLSEVFKFSASLNKSRKSDFTSFRPTLQNTLEALESTVALSRGMRTHLRKIESSSFGDVDALGFVAACRIFADWRSLRLVPDGYQRYAVGMKIAHRDLLQNIAKIEAAVHRYMEHFEESSQADASSPTLRELLQFELNQNVHRRLPKLTDQSGASGLLWTLRQVRYQSQIFRNIAQVPIAFPSGKAACMAAYHSTYGDYHGFFTRQIFQASFDAAPDAHVILQNLSVTPEEDVSRATQSFSEEDSDSESYPDDTADDWIQLELDTSESLFVQDYLIEQVVEPNPPPANPVEQLGSHIASEWMKFLRLFEQCGGNRPQQRQPHHSRNVMDSRSFRLPQKERETTSFIDFMLPLLDDLDALMKSNNMNDPSRV